MVTIINNKYFRTNPLVSVFEHEEKQYTEEKRKEEKKKKKEVMMTMI